MLSPDTPIEAMLERDGWALDDAELRLIEGRSIYWLPARADRVSVQPGDVVKLIFRIAQTLDPRHEDPHYEWMWVKVEHAMAGWWRGTLDNDPHKPGRTRCGMTVWFRPEHIIDLLKADGWRASEGEDVLRCDSHGHSHVTYVCEHLVDGATGRGFYTAEAPWPGNPRPDAWCAACEAILEEAGSWEAAGDRHPKLAILCGGCYDACRQRNLNPSPSDPGAA
jgi:hypothetical protein